MLIAIHSTKGSPGATTTAIALARRWEQLTGRQLMYIDADVYGGDVAQWFNVGIQRTVYDLLTASINAMSPNIASCVQEITGTPVYAAINNPGSLIGLNMAVYWPRAISILKAQSEKYDMLIDMGRVGLDMGTAYPNSLAHQCSAIYSAADVIILATATDHISLGHTKTAVEAFAHNPEYLTRLALLTITNEQVDIPAEYIDAQPLGTIPALPKAIMDVLNPQTIHIRHRSKPYFRAVEQIIEKLITFTPRSIHDIAHSSNISQPQLKTPNLPAELTTTETIIAATTDMFANNIVSPFETPPPPPPVVSPTPIQHTPETQDNVYKPVDEPSNLANATELMWSIDEPIYTLENSTPPADVEYNSSTKDIYEQIDQLDIFSPNQNNTPTSPHPAINNIPSTPQSSYNHNIDTNSAPTPTNPTIPPNPPIKTYSLYEINDTTEDAPVD